MKLFIIRRLFALIFLLFGVTLFTFFLMQLSPGDFLTHIKANHDVAQDYVQTVSEQFGIVNSWPARYIAWIKSLLKLDFGTSWTYNVPVTTLIKQRVSATLCLSIAALIVAWVVAIPLGVIAAVNKNKLPDKIISFISYGFLSIPEFFLAIIAVFFAAKTGLFPTMGRTSITHDFMPIHSQFIDILKHLLLPAIVLGVGNVASILRITRSSFLDFYSAEFVITARAKGVKESIVVLKHVLLNAINPLITHFGFAFSSLLSGALLIENVFNYPGLGLLLYEAFMSKDQHVVMAAVMLSCTMLVVGNFIADILIAILDPRIRSIK